MSTFAISSQLGTNIHSLGSRPRVVVGNVALARACQLYRATTPAENCGFSRLCGAFAGRAFSAAVELSAASMKSALVAVAAVVACPCGKHQDILKFNERSAILSIESRRSLVGTTAPSSSTRTRSLWKRRTPRSRSVRRRHRDPLASHATALTRSRVTPRR